MHTRRYDLRSFVLFICRSLIIRLTDEASNTSQCIEWHFLLSANKEKLLTGILVINLDVQSDHFSFSVTVALRNDRAIIGYWKVGTTLIVLR